MSTPGRRGSTRKAESRTAERREMPQTDYEGMLHFPKHMIPKGMAYRWVRIETQNQPDGNNFRAAVIKGWKPVPRSNHPDVYPTINLAGITQDSEDTIRVGGQILCMRPLEDVLRDKRRQEKRTMDDVMSFSPFIEGAPVINNSTTGIERVVSEAAKFQED